MRYLLCIKKISRMDRKISPGIFQEFGLEKATDFLFFPFLEYRIYNLFLNFSDCSRILFATWWLYVVILTSSYTGGLTAFMSSTG